MRFANARGLLAIWNDVVPEKASDFERWYQTEHLPERLSVPGFRLGRRWEAVEAEPWHFCCYHVDGPEVLSSHAYMDRLNNPTPWTRRVMAEAFQNMTRSACTLVASEGSSRGGMCVVARLQNLEKPALKEALGKLTSDPGVARWELWEAVPTEVTEEERLRGGDARIQGCILVETLRRGGAELVRDRLARAVRDRREMGIYRLLCAHGRADAT